VSVDARGELSAGDFGKRRGNVRVLAPPKIWSQAHRQKTPAIARAQTLAIIQDQ
jgi:hypothetical protein